MSFEEATTLQVPPGLVDETSILTNNEPNPITEGILLEEFFSQVFEIPFRKWDGCCDGNFVVA